MLVITKRPTQKDHELNSASYRKQTQIRRLIIGNKQRCLECFSVRVILGKGIVKLQPIDKKYIHYGNCSQAERF